MVKPFYLDLEKSEIEDIQEKLGEILTSGQLILGKYTEEFEGKFAKYIGSKYAVSMNSGTSALEVLLRLKNAEGLKVAVPNNTNFASVAAIMRVNATPVLMDMTNEYFVPDLKILKYTHKKNPDLSGVMWVHIGGIISPDFDKVVEYCKKNKIFLIEDAAHAHGSQFKGIKAGNFADGGAFSFFPTKVMTTMEGGMVTTNSKEDASLIKSFRNQGKRDGNFGGMHYDLGNSWRLSEIAAYIGIVQLEKLDRMISTRQSAVDKLMPVLDDMGLKYCDTSHMDSASQYKFIVRYNNNEPLNKIKENFVNDGIILGGGVYESPIHEHPVFKDLDFDLEDLKTSVDLCPKHICPPITSGTTAEDVDLIIDALKKYLK